MGGDENTKGENSQNEHDDDDDDHATVVLDINKLKEEMAKKNDLSHQVQDLEFGTTPEEEQGPAIELKVILFEFGSPLFKDSSALFPNAEIVTDVKVLSQKLKSKDKQVVVFNYAGDPKAVNTLCKQIKEKFQGTKTIIAAKNLSASKVSAHQKSPSGANAYLDIPLEADKISQAIETISALF